MDNKLVNQSDEKLEDKLDSIILPDEDTDKIVKQETAKTLISGLLETFGLGGAVKVLETAKKIEDEINDRKKAILLAAYFADIDKIKEEIAKLEAFVSDPVGNTLFSKIIRIVNDNPPNKAYVELFAKILKKFVDSNFQKLFSKHAYALNQIEKLTPQALLVLADYGNWPEFHIRNYASNNGIITTEWVEEFLIIYVQVKNITDDGMSRRIAHALRELLRNGFIRGKLQNETDSKDLSSVKASTDNPAMCDLTELGREIIDYLD